MSSVVPSRSLMPLRTERSRGIHRFDPLAHTNSRERIPHDPAGAQLLGANWDMSQTQGTQVMQHPPDSQNQLHLFIPNTNAPVSSSMGHQTNAYSPSGTHVAESGVAEDNPRQQQAINISSRIILNGWDWGMVIHRRMSVIATTVGPFSIYYYVSIIKHFGGRV